MMKRDLADMPRTLSRQTRNLIHSAAARSGGVGLTNLRRRSSGVGLRWLLLAIALLAGCLPDPLPPTAVPPTIAAFPTPQPTVLRNIGQNDPTAASLPSGGALPPQPIALTSQAGGQPVQIVTGDGTLLIGDLYANADGRRVPAVLLLAVDRAGWLDLPLRLQAAGYTALAVDLRAGSTEATPPPLGDFAAIMDALIEVATVDPGLVAVIGGGVGADAALAGCASDLRCDALALFGVTPSVSTVALLQYNPRPLFLSQGTDSPGFIAAGQIRANARSPLRYEEVASMANGPELIQRQPALIDALIGWLGSVLEPA